MEKLNEGATIINGDILKHYKEIERGSVDLILTDPPYGIIDGLFGVDWDKKINALSMFKMSNYLLRKGGRLVFFSQEPYTSELIQGATNQVQFNYRMVWSKNSFANHLGVNKAPLNYFEDILVFTKNHDENKDHELREYFKKVVEYIGETPKKIMVEYMGNYRAMKSLYYDGIQFSLLQEDAYESMVDIFKLRDMKGFMEYKELRAIDRKYDKIFNLPEGKNHMSNILVCNKEPKRYSVHPTQKPVKLLQTLITTYSNPGDLVVDLTMGSGSTGVAAINEDRRFIGCEMVDEYYEISKERISEAISKKEEMRTNERKDNR